MLQVVLKLNLSRQKKVIQVMYNTFEKATFDEFLMASLALHKTGEREAKKYIDDITGQGSLNSHFKNMYEETKKFSKEELKNIMSSSLYPTLKIDRSNRYEYYPELDCSVFNGRLYKGDLETYSNLIEMLQINEYILECSIEIKKDKHDIEPYTVRIDNDEISINLNDNWLSISGDVFEQVLSVEDVDRTHYQGAIHKGADGTGWSILTNSVVNNMFSNDNYYYDADNNHCQIRNDNVKRTIISYTYGIYIYKEEFLKYDNNAALCDKVLDILYENKGLNEFKTRSLITLITEASDIKAQKIINYILERKDSKEIALFGLRLLHWSELEKGWSDVSLRAFLRYAETKYYTSIYKANPSLEFSIEQLNEVDVDELSYEDKAKVDEFKKNKEELIKAINAIIGEIVNSGLREKIKAYKKDDDAKKFNNMANKMQGHVKNDINKVDMKTLETWYSKVVEMRDLMLKLQQKYNL